MKRYAFALLLILPMTADAQVLRCPDGSYSNRCSGGVPIDGGNVSTYEAPSTPRIQNNQQHSERYRSAGQATRRERQLQGPSSVRQRAQAAGLTRNELVKARSRGTLLPGMTRQDVDHIMGTPDDVDTFVSSGRRCDNLWYHDSRRGWHTRVTMCSGQLDSYGADTR